ncbi:uncharacterized protein AKAME5_000444600 [Lates japonicus]|uniref:Uncharacterized protein n=1 Tax=Lates japonicus TaxID=270547 RepID=A0AAD3R1D5_LATJO|nr:uncharacterized protein AKAME5_000444600 [Lates japonicus]
MSFHENCERPQTKPVADIGSEANGLESFIHSLSIRVEYYRSFEYRLKWKGPMYPRRSSRLPQASKKSPQRSPSPNEEVIQRKLRGKRRGAWQRKTKADEGVVNTDKRSKRDIIDIINDTRDASVAEKDEGKFVAIADKGVDESDDDCCSVNSSIASGPSLLPHTSPRKQRPAQGLCSACQKLYQRAKKMKAPIKNKLLDNDPKSLTCDQWVLIKKWMPRRLPNARGKLLIHVQRVTKKLRVKKGLKQHVGESSACSRPHTFLQRNLRCCVRATVKKDRKKKMRRKRTRDDSQGSRVAKQQRRHSNRHRQHTGDDSGPLPTSSPVALETTKPKELKPKQKTTKKTSGFRDLLAQLRGNSSIIVRETR